MNHHNSSDSSIALPDWSRWAGRPWIIALSGGADSSVLLALAHKNRQKAASLEAVYVHHHLQAVADSWEDFCRKRCQELGIPFTCEHVTVDTSRGSTEAEARKVRYEALSRHMEALHNPVLFTAHHKNDLLESVLLALFRGSSLRGLLSLKPEKTFRNGTLARPLLSMTRSEIEEYARSNGIRYVTDPTNLKDCYDRNFIRNRVTPLLRERFPDCAEATALTVEHLAMEERVLERHIAALLKENTQKFPGISIPVLNLGGFSRERERDEVMLVIREFLRRQNLTPSRGKLEELLRMWLFPVPDKTGHIMENGTRITVYGDCIHRVPFFHDRLKNCTVRLISGGQPDNPELAGHSPDYIFRIVRNPEVSGPDLPLPPEITLHFLPALSEKLRFPGRSGSTLIKNFWKENRIPVYLRCCYPLWSTGGEIMGVWHLRDTVRGREKFGIPREQDPRGFPLPVSAAWELRITKE
ncbi:tRNA lysidine(34) synthetase TilS [Succinimonas amylolytica]|uniref:tRNA lysidine(34) synthetase TilS n=1 Tax=Succinimonas amylolytica TaxID=83769 RepID=UPI0023A90B64